MKFNDAIMKLIREETDTPDEYCKQIEKALIENMPSPFDSLELWTLPEIKKEAVNLTGHLINSQMADDISVKLYSDLSNSQAFTPELIDQMIINSFDERFSNITIAPVDNGEPPKIVEADIADKFLAVGILAEAQPPKDAGDAEIISNLGADEATAEEYAQFVSKNTKHDASIHGPGAPDSPSMTS